MIRAYGKEYLSSATTVLGRVFDYATHDGGMSLTPFWDAFLTSPLCTDFEMGEPRVVAGMSGVELARAVMAFVGIGELPPARYALSRSPEYWTGWLLARYQWETALPYHEITEAIPIEEVRGLYHPYHEMDVRQAVDCLNNRYRSAFPASRLKRRREAAGLTQRELADRSGVPLRTIQQYEQRQKEIAHAGAETAVRIARALRVEVIDVLDLVEPYPEKNGAHSI